MKTKVGLAIFKPFLKKNVKSYINDNLNELKKIKYDECGETREENVLLDFERLSPMIKD